MDRAAAKNIKRSKLRVVKNRMEGVRAKMETTYEKNRDEIDFKVQNIIHGICATQPINPEAMRVTFKNVLDSFFYKDRASAKVLKFLDLLSTYPSEVIYETVLSYSMFLLGDDKKITKKHSLQYFKGFARKQFFEYKNQKNRSQRTSMTKDLPDDL